MLRLSFLVAFLLAGLWAVTALFGPALVADQHQGKSPALPLPLVLPVPADQAAPSEAPLPISVQRLADAAPVLISGGPIILTDVAPSEAMLQLSTHAATGFSGATGATSFRQVTARSANVRSSPSLQGAVLGQLARGDEVVVLQSSGNGWLQVRQEGDGFEGWISQKLLSE